jgi:hypothetical protein
VRTEETRTRFEQLCVARLGDDMGPRVAALARNGFSLTPVKDGEAASGRFRFGGPALLDPGTPWPTFEDTPMHLLAVMDTDALAPWLDVELPPGAGLLNVFYLGHERGVERALRTFGRVTFEAPLGCRVIPADPVAASEVPNPNREAQLPPRPVRADPVLALPDTTRVYRAPTVHDPGDEEVWRAFERLHDRLPEFLGEDEDRLRIRNLPNGMEDMEEDVPQYDEHRAFGWPWAMQGEPIPDTGRVHLLQLDTDEAWCWADCGMVTIDIAAEALRAGDFGTVSCTMESC